ncbi:hypothetical protein [Lignipirellula cremea]|uniref:Uncharacterized protein n=1 Tax=Lignipirellula cremea TaxID=2528010 RepID=A0A518DSW4_9BACT|nr:hypothetical protein [Lignipirellula cremea]QDU94929.1 hypothetical protein Pla8534_27370 [Lignipirellula cremea]
MKLFTHSLLGIVAFSWWGCLGCQEPTLPPQTTAPPQVESPLESDIKVNRSDLIGFWKSGPDMSISLREDGGFASTEDLPSQGRWRLRKGCIIELRIRDTPNVSLSYHILRFEENQMELKVEDNTTLQLQRVMADKTSLGDE